MPHPGEQHRDTPASVNPFVDQKPHISEYTALELATLSSRLDKQLGPEYISTRPGAGGGKVHYLAADKAINLANEILGFNGWSSSIQNVQIDFVDENSTTGKISLGLSTIVRVTLKDGMYHEDIGYGHIENCKGKAAAFEKAKKEAVTDALKRALRGFGKVLGNCLYDKDYLQRITKVKVAPSRWDADNLHRHPDYVPIKKEAIQDAGAKQESHQQQDTTIQRNQNVQPLVSAGLAEFEDDFGGSLFDETDFSHPDEMLIQDTSLTSIKSPAQRTVSGPRQSVASRTTSTPQMKPPNMLPPRHSTNAPVAERQNGGPKAVETANRTVPQNAQRPQPNGGTPGAANRAPIDEYSAPLPQDLPPGAPAGFVTGRSAALLNQPPESRPPTSSMAFNPHADSPSIRRTAGVNPGKSAPILRQAIPGLGTTAGTGAATRATTPNRSNFVDPSADANRRVGAPIGAANMGANRGSYKMPSTVGLKRPPLNDMSNIQQTDGASDSKKPKVEQTELVGGEPRTETISNGPNERP
ncbi:Hypothetical protein R9X50_00133000 [Acrodontium crateriforme]|uniref:RAD52 homolog n=1 Tax=Acrodontium crateriforme TaxID=150365 RepID=A0AAQ3LZA7_9PEZI|nr:Hypothetical protein R9X50_00133000 [Acrodontium crateriforme]